MAIRNIISYILCLQIIFAPFSYANDDGPDFDFSDEPFIITPGEDEYEGQEAGNCTGGGCDEGEHYEPGGSDYFDQSDQEGFESNSDSYSRDTGVETVERPFEDPEKSIRNPNIISIQIAQQDIKDGNWLVVKDTQGNTYYRENFDENEYGSNRDAYFSIKGVPFVKSVDGLNLMNIDGLKECVPDETCASKGYREDWWNYDVRPKFEDKDESNQWHDTLSFYEKNNKVKSGIAAAREKNLPTSESWREKSNHLALNEVEYLNSEAKIEFRNGIYGNAYVLQDAAGKLLNAIIWAGSAYFTPIGWVEDTYGVITGRSLIDGHELSRMERIFAGIGSISPTLGPLGYAGMRLALRGGRAAKEAKVFSTLLNLRAQVFVKTPFGNAYQDFTNEALKVKAIVMNSNVKVYRIGTRGKSATGKEAQFWALDHPYTPGYFQKYGIPASNYEKANFIEVGRVKPGTVFVTRPSPKYGSNSGGGIEIVVPENGVIIEGHHSL